MVVTIIIGTIAKPSNPSVRFTALEEPTITNIENINQKYPTFIISSLKMGNVKNEYNLALNNKKVKMKIK